MKAGICRFCGCSEFDACVVDGGLGPEGCSWIDPTRTVCSACAAAAKAEAHALRVHPELAAYPAPLAAYHQGFVVGWFGVRGRFKRNPYAGADVRSSRIAAKANWWRLGQMAGEAAVHQHRLSAGPLENTPRRDVFRRVRQRDRRPDTRRVGAARRVAR